MPLHPSDIVKHIGNPANEKDRQDLLSLLIKRINKLCFDECQIDRILCTLTPLCFHRFLLKMRIKNGLTLEDLPKFCYNVQKNIVFRDFRNKTVVYRPFDSYLYLIDFLDIFFHGDYRKLNKFISFQKWEEAFDIFNYRIEKKQENFSYHLIDNYIIFKFDKRIHIIFINEKYVLCNANRETIASVEILKGVVDLYNKLYFPDVKTKLIRSKYVVITSFIPKDILAKISDNPLDDDSSISKLDDYFFNNFSEDLEALTKFCKKIRLRMNLHGNLEIKLYISLDTNNYIDGKKMPLRYRDMRIFLNFIYYIYNDFYVIWLE